MSVTNLSSFISVSVWLMAWVVSSSPSPIRIGVFECTTACFVPHIDVLHGMWFDAVNARGGILGRPVEKVVSWIGVSSIADDTEMEVATQFLLDQYVDFVLWPLGNNFWSRGMALLETHQIPAIGSGTVYSSLFRCDQRSAGEVGCRTNNGIAISKGRRFEFVHSPSSVDEYYLLNWVALLHVQGATTLAIIRVVTVLYDAIEENLHQLAKDYHMEVIYSAIAPSQGLTVNETTALEFTQILSRVAADGVVLLVINCSVWLQAMHTLDYMPSAVISLNCVDNSGSHPILERNFIAGPVLWDARLDGSELTEKATDAWAHYAPINNSNSVTTSPSLFVLDWRRHYNSTDTPGYTYAVTIGGLEMLEAAIILANTTNGPQVNEQLRTMSQPSFYGLLQTNAFGFNQYKPILILQQDHQGVTQIVAPIQFATANFIYPTPTWRERIYQQHLFGTPVEQIFVLLIILSSTFTLMLICWVCHRWNHSDFRASGPSTYIVIAIGCLSGYASILTWSIENYSQQCIWRVWLMNGAFHAVIQPLLIATYKVQHILSGARLLVPSITVERIRVLRVAAAVPVGVINLIWTWITPLQPTVITADSLRPAGSFTVCTLYPSFGWIPLLFSGVYGGALLVLTCIYAYRIRQLPGAYHDAKSLALSIYLFTFAVLCIVISQVILGNRRDRSVEELTFTLRSTAALLIASRIRFRCRFRRNNHRPNLPHPIDMGQQQQQEQQQPVVDCPSLPPSADPPSPSKNGVLPHDDAVVIIHTLSIQEVKSTSDAPISLEHDPPPTRNEI